MPKKEKKGSILLVEDNDDTQALLEEIIIKLGYDVISASSAEEAQDLIDEKIKLIEDKEKPFDIMMTDIGLPNISGLELLRIYKTQHPKSGVVMISGDSRSESIVNAIKIGADDYLTKPIHIKDLDKCLQKVFEELRERKLKKDIDFVQKVRALSKDYPLLKEGTEKEIFALIHNIMSSILGKSERHMILATEDSKILGKRLGLDYDKINQCCIAAQVHDIGKIRFPTYILEMPELPTQEQKEQYIYKHPIYGEEYIKNISDWELAAKIVLEHHESWDGSGYPYGKKREQILLEARVIRPTLEFYSILLGSPRKKAKMFDEAIEILESYSGTRLDPDINKIYLDYLIGEKTFERHLQKIYALPAPINRVFLHNQITNNALG